MEPRARIVLAEDHRLVREALRHLLERDLGADIVGEAADGTEAIALALRLAPDVLVLDLMMPGLGGLDVLQRLRKERVATRVVVVSVHDDQWFVVRALRAGASAFVTKGARAAELVQAVRDVLAGTPAPGPALPARAEARGVALTPRERTVLRLVAEGHTARQVARELGISPRTAEAHRANLMRKLGLRGQTELVRYALAAGIVAASR